MPSPTGYERDILDQPDAIARVARAVFSKQLASLNLGRFGRILLAGMGSSDYATIPLEQAMASRGWPVWRLPAGRLLEMPALITAPALLWLTSQSGRSGEVVALLDRLPRHGVTVVGVTNDPASPLGHRADLRLDLDSGDEATVSSKSYLNTLAWVSRVAAWVRGGAEGERLAAEQIGRTAETLRAWLSAPSPDIATLAARTLAGPQTRIALVGAGADAATALTGGLILKEAAKVAAEGYAGGAFRHGPMELAGPGLTVLLFGTGAEDDATIRHLARDLARTGSAVAAITPVPLEGATHIPVSGDSEFARLAHGMAVVQQLSVALARQAGIAPGEFRWGQKITATL